jgi:hypothetical protein
MATPEPPPFLFVVGAGRSGTSLLRTVLDGHSHLAVSHEGRFVYPLSRRRRRYERPSGFDIDAFAADLLADPAVRGNLGLDAAGVQRALAGAPITDYPDAVRRVFADYARRDGKPRYGDKMPAYVLRMPALATMFPEARFVHIVRDGRDVALSAAAFAGRPGDPIGLGIDWRRRVAAGRAAGRLLGDGRYHELRYEHLVTDPATTVRSLCRYLDVDFEPDMLRVPERHVRAPAKLQANPRHARLAEPIAPSQRSWRTDMERADVERFEAAAGDLLEELGYERGAPHPSLTARIAARWGYVRRQADRAQARLPGAARRTLRRPLASARR